MGLAASRQEAFWEACGFGHLERARRFLQEGDIDVNWVSYTNDCCPIHVASQGKLEIVQLLLEHKCDVNVRDNRGNLPLHHAAMKGFADIVQVLLDAGCDINAQEKNGWTALHNAAYWCHPQVVKLLLNNGCDVNIQNKDERTALHECSRSQERDEHKLGDIARLLISAGSDINSKSSDWGEGDLTGLMYAAFHNHPEVANALIEAGCDLNSVGTTFWTALHWAADRGNDELVYILLEAGIDPTIRDMRGETAMHRAQSDAVREFLSTAIDLHKELHRVKHPIVRPASKLVPPAEPFKPKCDANFKSKSFLPEGWKPTNSVNVKNLINEKKSRLAAMTSQKYREDLARRTGTGVIKDEQDSFDNVNDSKKPADGSENNLKDNGLSEQPSQSLSGSTAEMETKSDVTNEVPNSVEDSKHVLEQTAQSELSQNDADSNKACVKEELKSQALTESSDMAQSSDMSKVPCEGDRSDDQLTEATDSNCHCDVEVEGTNELETQDFDSNREQDAHGEVNSEPIENNKHPVDVEKFGEQCIQNFDDSRRRLEEKENKERVTKLSGDSCDNSEENKLHEPCVAAAGDRESLPRYSGQCEHLPSIAGDS